MKYSLRSFFVFVALAALFALVTRWTVNSLPKNQAIVMGGANALILGVAVVTAFRSRRKQRTLAIGVLAGAIAYLASEQALILALDSSITMSICQVLFIEPEGETVPNTTELLISFLVGVLVSSAIGFLLSLAHAFLKITN